MPAQPASPITQGLWYWERTEYSDDTTLVSSNPSQYTLALLADIAPAAAELDRRAAELEHQVRVLRDLVAPVAVRCTDHASGD